MIKVTVQGGKTVEVPYREGIKLGEVLAVAKARKPFASTLTVENKKVGGWFWKRTIVRDNSLVIITPNVSNG